MSIDQTIAVCSGGSWSRQEHLSIICLFHQTRHECIVNSHTNRQFSVPTFPTVNTKMMNLVLGSRELRCVKGVALVTGGYGPRRSVEVYSPSWNGKILSDLPNDRYSWGISYIYHFNIYIYYIEDGIIYVSQSN